MEFRLRPLTTRFLLLIAVLTFFLAACSPTQASQVDVRIAGARDMQPILGLIKNGFSTQSGYSVEEKPSENVIDDLKRGRVDLIILGREPKPDELVGLSDTVIAYDAIVMVVSTRTYYGGEYWIPQGTNETNLPDKKFDGVQNLNLSDLTGLFSTRLGLSSNWNLGVPLYQYKAAKTIEGNLILDTTTDPPQFKGSWAASRPSMPGYLYPPGQYDLQTSLFDILQLPQPEPKARLGIMPSHLQSEEELLSFVFRIDPALATPVSYSVGFDLFMVPFSRNVVVRALEHEFSINALRVENIDPLGDPQLIYDQTYPLSQEIHVLTLASASAPVESLVQYLLSSDGQSKIAELEYLPLPEFAISQK